MNRRGFLIGMGGVLAAPAIVRADSLMRIVPREMVLDVIPFTPTIHCGYVDRYEAGMIDEFAYIRVGDIVTISGSIGLCGEMGVRTINLRTKEEAIAWRRKG